MDQISLENEFKQKNMSDNWELLKNILLDAQKSQSTKKGYIGQELNLAQGKSEQPE